MRQWSPDDIVPSVATRKDDGGTSRRENPDFIEDRPTDGASAFLKRLEPEEREDLYAMVREELAEEIRQELHESFGNEVELVRGALAPLKEQILKAVDDDLHAMAIGAVQLAVAIGERLARNTIELDDTYLVRCLEELVDRTLIGAELTVIAHPSEVARLEQHAEQLRDLNVVNLVPERGLAPRGCIVKSAGQEWDLTFRGQVDALADMADEAMRYGRDTERRDVVRSDRLDVVEPCEVTS